MYILYNDMYKGTLNRLKVWEFTFVHHYGYIAQKQVTTLIVNISSTLSLFAYYMILAGLACLIVLLNPKDTEETQQVSRDN